jgi:hypothetical protein
MQLTEGKWREKRKKKGGITKGGGVAAEAVYIVYFCRFFFVRGRKGRVGEEIRVPQACSAVWRLMEGMTDAASGQVGTWKGAVEQGNRSNTHLSVTSKVPSDLSDISRGFTRSRHTMNSN